MAQEQLAIAGTGILNAAIGATDTTLTLQSPATGFPLQAPFGLWFWETGEYVRVNAVSKNADGTLTCALLQRGQGINPNGWDKTTAAAHNQYEQCVLLPNLYNVLSTDIGTTGPLALIWLALHQLNSIPG